MWHRAIERELPRALRRTLRAPASGSQPKPLPSKAPARSLNHPSQCMPPYSTDALRAALFCDCPSRARSTTTRAPKRHRDNEGACSLRRSASQKNAKPHRATARLPREALDRLVNTPSLSLGRAKDDREPLRTACRCSRNEVPQSERIVSMRCAPSPGDAGPPRGDFAAQSILQTGCSRTRGRIARATQSPPVGSHHPQTPHKARDRLGMRLGRAVGRKRPRPRPRRTVPARPLPGATAAQARMVRTPFKQRCGCDAGMGEAAVA